MRQKVFYLCDRKRCKPCRPDCHHTTDPEHALDFEETHPGVYFQRPPEEQKEQDCPAGG